MPETNPRNGNGNDDENQSHRRYHHRSSREPSSHSREEQLDNRRRHKHRRRHSESRHSSDRSLSPGEIRQIPKRHKRHSQRESKSTPKLVVNPSKSPSPTSNTSLPLEKLAKHPSPQEEDFSSDSEAIGPMPLLETKSEFIPRRGEHGHDAKDIERFEQMGFVMSGKRKKRRISDDGKKRGPGALKEEKLVREREIVSKFREMIEERRGREREA